MIFFAKSNVLTIKSLMRHYRIRATYIHAYIHTYCFDLVTMQPILGCMIAMFISQFRSVLVGWKKCLVIWVYDWKQFFDFKTRSTFFFQPIKSIWVFFCLVVLVPRFLINFPVNFNWFIQFFMLFSK